MLTLIAAALLVVSLAAEAQTLVPAADFLYRAGKSPQIAFSSEKIREMSVEVLPLDEEKMAEDFLTRLRGKELPLNGIPLFPGGEDPAKYLGMKIAEIPVKNLRDRKNFLLLPVRHPGMYLLSWKIPSKQKINTLIKLSRAVLTSADRKNGTVFFVCDLQSGRGIPGVRLKVCDLQRGKNKNTLLERSFRTGKDGMVFVPGKIQENTRRFAFGKAENSFLFCPAGTSREFSSGKAGSDLLISDTSLAEPGKRISFFSFLPKGSVWKVSGPEGHTIFSGKADSCPYAGSFVLPGDLLPGRYFLSGGKDGKERISFIVQSPEKGKKELFCRMGKGFFRQGELCSLTVSAEGLGKYQGNLSLFRKGEQHPLFSFDFASDRKNGHFLLVPPSAGYCEAVVTAQGMKSSTEFLVTGNAEGASFVSKRFFPEKELYSEGEKVKTASLLPGIFIAGSMAAADTGKVTELSVNYDGKEKHTLKHLAVRDGKFFFDAQKISMLPKKRSFDFSVIFPSEEKKEGALQKLVLRVTDPAGKVIRYSGGIFLFPENSGKRRVCKEAVSPFSAGIRSMLLMKIKAFAEKGPIPSPFISDQECTVLMPEVLTESSAVSQLLLPDAEAGERSVFLPRIRGDLLIMVRSSDGKKAFWRGTLPVPELELLPDIPSYLTEGDRCEVGITVRNNRSTLKEFRIAPADKKGLLRIHCRKELFRIPAGKSGILAFEMEALKKGVTLVDPGVTSEKEKYDLHFPVPVCPAGRRFVLESRTCNAKDLNFYIPGNCRKGSENLEILLTPGIPVLLEVLREKLEHDEGELPLRDQAALVSFFSTIMPYQKIPVHIQKMAGRLRESVNSDGISEKSPLQEVSRIIDAADALLAARKGGMRLPPEMLSRTFERLALFASMRSRRLQGNSVSPSLTDVRLSALLKRGGKEMPDLAETLYTLREKFPPAALSELALSMSPGHHRTDLTRMMDRFLVENPPENVAYVMIPEKFRNTEQGNPIESQASFLKLLCRNGAGNKKLTEQAADYLALKLSARRAELSFASLCKGFLALSEYEGKKKGNAPEMVTGAVFLDGKKIGGGRFAGKMKELRLTVHDPELLKSGSHALRLAASGGKIYLTQRFSAESTGKGLSDDADVRIRRVLHRIDAQGKTVLQDGRKELNLHTGDLLEIEWILDLNFALENVRIHLRAPGGFRFEKEQKTFCFDRLEKGPVKIKMRYRAVRRGRYSVPDPVVHTDHTALKVFSAPEQKITVKKGSSL